MTHFKHSHSMTHQVNNPDAPKALDNTQEAEGPTTLAANPSLLFGQGNVATMNAVATAMNPGVSPPDHWQNNFYKFHHRLGQNARCAPILLGLIDDPTQDMSTPSNAFIAANGPEWWNPLSPNFKQPNNYGAAPNFPPLYTPPASMTGGFPWMTEVAVFQLNGGGPAVPPWIGDVTGAGFPGWIGGAIGRYLDSSTMDLSGVANPAPMEIYQSLVGAQFARLSLKGFIPNSDYVLRLHLIEFAETHSYGSATFKVYIVGGPDIFTNINVYNSVGINKAMSVESTVTTDGTGQLLIEFERTAGTFDPLVAGVEVLQRVPR